MNTMQLSGFVLIVTIIVPFFLRREIFGVPVASAFQIIQPRQQSPSTCGRCCCSPATNTKLLQHWSASSSVNYYDDTNTEAAAAEEGLLDGLIDIDERAPRDISAFAEWAFEQCGVQRSDGFQLTNSASDGGSGSDTDMSMDQRQKNEDDDVSVMTTEDLPPNSPVLFVPHEMIISSNQAYQEFGNQLLEAATAHLEGLNAPSNKLQYLYLMIKILVEYEKGSQSPWYPWLNSLPRYFSNGPSMTIFCLECLPPLVSSLAMKERGTCTLLCSALNFVPFLSDQTKANEDLCKWAYQIATTRSFEVPAISDEEVSGDDRQQYDLRIVPMADMFNHGSSETEIEIAYDDQGNCYAQTTKDVPAGSPLRISYGDPTNPSYLLARYGFLDESSPATFCKIMIANMNDELLNMGYAHNRMLFYKDTGEVSNEVWDVSLYQILSSSSEPDAAQRLEEFYNAHMAQDYDTKQSFHQRYWPETSAKLLHHINTFLEELDELSTKVTIGGIVLEEHPRLPLILKHNEFVKKTFLAVRERYFS